MKPCKKKVYKTGQEAWIASRELERATGDKTLVYGCKKCGGFHIGRPSAHRNPIIYAENIENLLSKALKKEDSMNHGRTKKMFPKS